MITILSRRKQIYILQYNLLLLGHLESESPTQPGIPAKCIWKRNLKGKMNKVFWTYELYSTSLPPHCQKSHKNKFMLETKKQIFTAIDARPFLPRIRRTAASLTPDSFADVPVVEECDGKEGNGLRKRRNGIKRGRRRGIEFSGIALNSL